MISQKKNVISEHFPKPTVRSFSTRFNIPYRRRQTQDNPENIQFEEFDFPIKERIKQYRIKAEKKQE